MKLFQEDVDDYISKNGDCDATELAYLYCDKELKELATAARALERAFMKIAKVFPNANLYSANDGLSLLLGDSHTSIGMHDCSEEQRIVNVKNWPHLMMISGGDW
jgi:hypothetical protein